MACEGIFEGTACAVVGLAGVSAETDERREDYEEVEGGGKLVVEVPTSLDFGTCGCGPVFEGHLFEDGIL